MRASLAFGLLGYPLKNSFSADYFNTWFREQNIDAQYQNYPLESAAALEEFLHTHTELKGFNITIPHKQDILQYLHQLDETAMACGAVNCVNRDAEGNLKGYNTDVIGFRKSLEELLNGQIPEQALVFGTGGASRAVQWVLQQMQIPFSLVSRTPDQGKGILCYADISPELMEVSRLLINTTPVGMFPDTQFMLPLPYEAITQHHYGFDLIYLPEETSFLKQAAQAGAHVMNGLRMLHYQADAAKRIWFPELFA